jgi:hypothetical protein
MAEVIEGLVVVDEGREAEMETLNCCLCAFAYLDS